jgi:hypothetical protein
MMVTLAALEFIDRLAGRRRFALRFGLLVDRSPGPPVSNDVDRADILRCPEVVADQAAGQKDVEADLWVRVSAV